MSRSKPGNIVLIAMLTVLTSGATAVAGDGLDGDVRAGYNTDLEDALIGGGVLFGVGSSGRWYANPNAEIVFTGNGEQISLNADFHYDFPMGSGATYWLGVGGALVHRDPDVGNDDTDPGVNLLAGIGAVHGKVRPFVQGRVTLKDDTEAAVVVGIRF